MAGTYKDIRESIFHVIGECQKTACYDFKGSLGKAISELERLPRAERELVREQMGELKRIHQGGGPHHHKDKIRLGLQDIDHVLTTKANAGTPSASSPVMLPNFPFVDDPAFLAILERDAEELTQHISVGSAPKAYCILSGSILEALLYERLTSKEYSAKAEAAILKETGKRIPPDDWTFEHMIEVAVALGLVPREIGGGVPHAVRCYRNFVHPRREVKSGTAPTPAVADSARSSLRLLVDHLSREWLKKTSRLFDHLRKKRSRDQIRKDLDESYTDSYLERLPDVLPNHFNRWRSFISRASDPRPFSDIRISNPFE